MPMLRPCSASAVVRAARAAATKSSSSSPSPSAAGKPSCFATTAASLSPSAASSLASMPPSTWPSVVLYASPSQPRGFATSAARASGGAPHYDPPTGDLFGVPRGEKYEREGWERGMALYVIATVLFVVALAFKPDTSIQTWALEEARRRLEKEGILEDPFPNTPVAKKDSDQDK